MMKADNFPGRRTRIETDLSDFIFLVESKRLTEVFTAMLFLDYHYESTQANGVIYGEELTGSD